LATGPTKAYVCTNGVVAIIENGLGSTDITIEVKVSDEPSVTMVECFNEVAGRLFTFQDPISKLTSEGHAARFKDSAAFESNLVEVIVMERADRLWFPPASKVLQMGWKYLEDENVRDKCKELARQSLTAARGVVNLRSPSEARALLKQYRSLLDGAQSEAELQSFLESHPEFVYPEYDQVISKPSLGGERVPDLAFSIRSASGSQWVFVEIERPDEPIFTTGDFFQFSGQFTQAKGQLLHWDNLLTQDHPYFSKRFPGLLKPTFHLICGRNKELDSRRREMITTEFSSASNRTFSTFDDLANRFERILDRVFPGL
jgi:hypothetical protein